MTADSQYLREHYASMSDEGLLTVDRSDLVTSAQKYYDEELERRALLQREATGPADARAGLEDIVEEKPDWLEDAACATTFFPFPGNEAILDAENACDVLKTSGILCYLDVHETDPEPQGALPPPGFEYRIMVPARLSLQAMSVLDSEVFNSAVEAEWKQYFATLSDDELRAVDSEILFRGLVDRLKRVTKAYEDELACRSVV